MLGKLMSMLTKACGASSAEKGVVYCKMSTRNISQCP